jgi:signal transduction histidine kinase
MKKIAAQEDNRQYLSWSDRQQYDKQLLALNALTDLARKFSDKPDFHELVDTVVLVLAGQFSAPSAFALLIPPGHSSLTKSYFATGKFRGNPLLSRLEISDEQEQYFLDKGDPQRVDKLSLSGYSANMSFILSECGVQLVAPLVHDNRLIGIFGLGDKANRKPFETPEYELLAMVINTITPLIVNSFLFHEISQVNDWYLQILDNVKQGVFVFGREYQLKKVNIPGYIILKTFRPHLKHIDSLNGIPLQAIFPNSIYPGLADQLMQMKKDSEGTTWEKMKAKLNSEERFYKVRASFMQDDSGTATDLLLTLDDVTVQEENEQRLFDLEKFAEKGMMASAISHELNNYLGLLMGGVELSQVAHGRGDADKVADTLEKVKVNIGKMERFTAGLMDYAKLDTVKKNGQINTAVNDVLSFIAVQKKFKNIMVHTKLDPDLPGFEMDMDQIAQLLLNLLNNASDAIRESGREAGEIMVRTAHKEDIIHLSVADNGCGIKPEIKEQLFKFLVTTKPGGHGYGLVVCSKIIKNHQAQLEIESEPGVGSTFTISFPVLSKS